jgi:hypothetical protein
MILFHILSVKISPNTHTLIHSLHIQYIAHGYIVFENEKEVYHYSVLKLSANPDSSTKVTKRVIYTIHGHTQEDFYTLQYVSHDGIPDYVSLGYPSDTMCCEQTLISTCNH